MYPEGSTPASWIWGVSANPVDVLSGWLEKKAPYLALGYTASLAYGVASWALTPITLWTTQNTALALLYVLVAGLLIAYLCEASVGYLLTANAASAVDCLVLFILLLLMTAGTFFTFGMFFSPVYLLLRATHSGLSESWLNQAAQGIRLRSEGEKHVARPCTTQTPLPLITAAKFEGFIDICEAYARWLARKGIITNWERHTGSVTYFIGGDQLPGKLSHRWMQSTWIRIDASGSLAIYVSPRDRRRLGGRKYRSLCENLARILSDNFFTYLVGQARRLA